MRPLLCTPLVPHLGYLGYKLKSTPLLGYNEDWEPRIEDWDLKNVWGLICVPHLYHICGTCGTNINVPHFVVQWGLRTEDWGLRIEVCEGWQLRCTEVYEVQSSYKSPQCVVIVVVVVYIWNHHTLWWFDKGSCVSLPHAPYSLLLTPYSLLFAPCSLLLAPYFLLLTPCSLLLTPGASMSA